MKLPFSKVIIEFVFPASDVLRLAATEYPRKESLGQIAFVQGFVVDFKRIRMIFSLLCGGAGKP